MILGVIGFIGAMLTVYLLHIEAVLAVNHKYKALCDINDKINCTAVAKSQYAHIFGISNAVLGILFYGLVAILDIFGEPQTIFYLSIPAFVFTLFLAYLMFFKIRKLCLVCLATYCINILIFIISAVKA